MNRLTPPYSIGILPRNITFTALEVLKPRLFPLSNYKLAWIKFYIDAIISSPKSRVTITLFLWNDNP